MLDTWAKSIGSRGGGRGGDVFGDNGSVGQGFDLDRCQVLVAAGGARADYSSRKRCLRAFALIHATFTVLFLFRDFVLDV